MTTNEKILATLGEMPAGAKIMYFAFDGDTGELLSAVYFNKTYFLNGREDVAEKAAERLGSEVCSKMPEAP
jgi:hypothetical protein